MRLAIMQPYIFPYIGYFQLIASVDKFVVYDDVSFIKQGWINRNRILLNGKDHAFVIQLKDASSFKLICDTQIHEQFYKSWKLKFYKTLEQSYKKAPYYQQTLSVLKEVLDGEHSTIAEKAVSSLKAVCNYINITTPFVESSSIYHNTHLSSQDRVIDICKKEKATSYTNSKNGMHLYSKEDFAADALDLKFISPLPIEYKQFENAFVPWLSIIDVLMFNSPEEVSDMLQQFELV